MSYFPSAELLEATRLTKAGRLPEATATLRRMLAAGRSSFGNVAQAPHEPPTIDGDIDRAEPTRNWRAPAESTMLEAGVGEPSLGVDNGTTKPKLIDAVRGFVDKAAAGGLNLAPGSSDMSPASVADKPKDGAQFLARAFSNEAGGRPYKLYVPSGYRGQLVPLIVMLHGCTQSPDDFAAGTRMNAVAEEHTFLVAYPGQSSSANIRKCWNWFSASDQRRDAGEPSLIAGITREVIRDYAVDTRRVFIAGLSAGGAAAAIMGDAYPDLYAAIGVHSGLACGAARDMPSAFAAMKDGSGKPPRSARSGHSEPNRRIVPAIVFHGDRDTTVNPANASSVVEQSIQGAVLRRRVEAGRVPGGLAYSRVLHSQGADDCVVEQWIVHGAGHAWSGGSPAGSYTLSSGPDASREMARFFLDHPLLE